MNGPPIIKVASLAVQFDTAHGPVDALRGISFELHRGEVLGIVGESGSGKTVACRSILRLLAGNARVVAGSIEFEGQNLLSLDDKGLSAVRGERIAMIFQNPSTHLDPLMTVGKQVGEALRAHHQLSRPEAREQSVKLLEDMRIPDPKSRVDAYSHQLSGGMRQRVMIAAALACKPSVLLADEPTTALDVTVQAQILDLLKRIRQERQLSIILVSHDLGVIAQMCDRVVVMKDGTIVESGPVDSIIRQPRQDYTKKLIASQPSLMPPGAHAATSGQTLLQLQGLTVHYPRPHSLVAALARHPRQVIKAVNGISLELRKGETLGIVGESGSGKSTVARAIVGLAPVVSGQIHFDGQPIDRRDKAKRHEFQRAVQMVFQDPFTSLNPAYTVGQTLAEPLRQLGLCAPREIPSQVAELMRRVELPVELLARRTNQLSGGQRQRVGIARALALRPKLIIADEVTSALDVTIQAQILGLFRKLRDDIGLSLILISHDLAVVRHLCERVAVMRGGELVEYGETARIFDDPQQNYTRELLAAIPQMNKASGRAGPLNSEALRRTP